MHCTNSSVMVENRRNSLCCWPCSSTTSRHAMRNRLWISIPQQLRCRISIFFPFWFSINHFSGKRPGGACHSVIFLSVLPRTRDNWRFKKAPGNILHFRFSIPKNKVRPLPSLLPAPVYPLSSLMVPLQGMTLTLSPHMNLTIFDGSLILHTAQLTILLLFAYNT